MRKRKQLIFGLLTVLTMAIACEDPPPPLATDISISDPEVTTPGCCQTTYAVYIAGLSPSIGRYYWLALMRGDSVVKPGTSIFTSGGAYNNQQLSVTIDYRDHIQPGDYELCVMGFDTVSTIGNAHKRVIEENGAIVAVPTFNSMDCFACDTFEVVLRSFIGCPIVDGTPYLTAGWFGYYRGDDRNFNYFSSYFRTSQILKIRYVPASDSWVVATGDTFGITQKVPDSVIEESNDPDCPYDLVSEEFTPICQDTAVDGVGGNLLFTQTFNSNGTAHVRMTMVGYNPCFGGPACAIDATFDLYMEADLVGELPTAYARVTCQHDQFPAYELYVRRLAGYNYLSFYEYDPGPRDIIYLCGWFANQISATVDWSEIR